MPHNVTPKENKALLGDYEGTLMVDNPWVALGVGP